MVYIENGILKNFSYNASGRRSRACARRWWLAAAAVAADSAAAAGSVRRRHEEHRGAHRRLARGILVTHFFYIRSLDPRTVLLTGLTRDGTFLIEKGKITRALKNFRWNESPLFMLSRSRTSAVPSRPKRGA